jgi:hypothetical protein
MLSRRWIRLIASAKSGATETTATLAELDGLRLDRVRDDQTPDRASVEASHRSLREDAVRDDSGNGARATRYVVGF